MEDVKTGWFGRVAWGAAGVLLLLVWLASMALDDDRLCNAVPLCFGFAGALLLLLLALLGGLRPPRPGFTCLFGLGAGLYFLIRCVAGDMLSEIARELPLIFAAFVFYGVGYVAAQRRGNAALMLALVCGVVANAAYFFLLQDAGLLQDVDLPPEVKGRPSMSLAGPNSPGAALFMYENFTGIFMSLAGFVLLMRPIWGGWRGWGNVLCLAVGAVGIAAPFMSGARAVYALPPLLLVVGWALWAIIRLYSGKSASGAVVFSGIAIFVGIGVLLGELFMGNILVQLIAEVDSHGRMEMWSSLLPLLPEVPWCGYGAGSVQWYLLPVVDGSFMANYAHNEYLQAWMDYGAVGVLLMLAVLLVHLGAGFWSLASEETGRERRALVAACMMLLIGMAACAGFDFVWHNVALTGLAAFACGVLASPVPSHREPLFSRRKWAPGSSPALRPVRPVGLFGSALCCTLCLSMGACCAAFAWKLLPGWRAQWEYNALCHAGATEEQRAEFLEQVMPLYPDPELVDHYASLRRPADHGGVPGRTERMMRMALRTNPRQLYTVVMLSDLLAREGHHAEAEALLRDNYAPGGMPRSGLANWPAYYGRNLLMWGHQQMMQGNVGKAYSMMEYALNLCGHTGGFDFPVYTTAEAGKLRNRSLSAYIAARRVDVDMLRLLGTQKDDSWKAPMRPGGPAALYEEWGTTPHQLKYRDPYAKNSPLKI